MNFLRLLTIGERKGRIATEAELVAALSAGAAYLAQGASYSYIRARTGMVAPQLMENAEFGAAMERCKWEGFAAAAADLVLIVEADLRPHGTAPAALWRRLYRAVLATHPVPPHRVQGGEQGGVQEGWDDRIAAFDARLDAHLAGPAGGIEDIAAFSAGVIIEYAPVDEIIRGVDREMVMNNVKFRFIDHVTALRRRTDWPALAAALGAAQGAGHESGHETGHETGHQTTRGATPGPDR